jgi:hypothetical protein
MVNGPYDHSPNCGTMRDLKLPEKISNRRSGFAGLVFFDAVLFEPQSGLHKEFSQSEKFYRLDF